MRLDVLIIQTYAFTEEQLIESHSEEHHAVFVRFQCQILTKPRASRGLAIVHSSSNVDRSASEPFIIDTVNRWLCVHTFFSVAMRAGFVLLSSTLQCILVGF